MTDNIENNTIPVLSTKNSKSPSLIDEILDTFDTVIFSVFIVILIFIFLFKIATVDGPSMNPTLTNGDKIVITHLFFEPQNNDIVVINSTGLKKAIVKRIIATSGQEIMIDFDLGKVSVDGVLQSEPFIKDLTTYNAGQYTYPLLVPEGYVFVMGDNRGNSTDSRSPSVRLVSEDYIVGKVIFRLFPFKTAGSLYN